MVEGPPSLFPQDSLGQQRQGVKGSTLVSASHREAGACAPPGHTAAGCGFAPQSRSPDLYHSPLWISLQDMCLNMCVRGFFPLPQPSF